MQATLTFSETLKRHRNFFATGTTMNPAYRVEVLRRLRSMIVAREDEICKALKADFGKSTYESLLSETQFVLAELDQHIKYLGSWSKPQKVKPSLANFPSTDRIYRHPYGLVLIIAPWNYPFNLAISPLIGALSAGNVAVIKPSELTPHTSALLAELITDLNVPDLISVVQGDGEIAQMLLQEKWDYIFFTGSVAVGKIVYQAAARHLTPVTLELGGKNPCVVDQTANINLTAKRLVWGKFLNGGQTCIAPDYILVHHQVKADLTAALQKEITLAYGQDPGNSEDYPRIVNHRHFDRLISLLEDQDIVFGGFHKAGERYLSPTLVNEPDPESALMQQEIFGPILPLIAYRDEQEIDRWLEKHPNPLAFYVFSSNMKFAKSLMKRYAFGGGCINDTVIHIANKRLPFGGIGNSGIGNYHGKRSFEIFSHAKPVLQRGTWLDIPIRYAPYKNKLGLAKWIHKFF